LHPNSSRPTGPFAKPIEVTPRLLRGWPLPDHDEDGDKEERGRVLIVGGAPEMPGAAILAATAALRAGAGKLQIATCRSIAAGVACSVPEALVKGVEESENGAFAASSADAIAEMANRVDAVLIGPGMVDEESVAELLTRLIPLLDKPIVVLDAAALGVLSANPQALYRLNGKAVITPHAGEMASILNVDKETVQKEARAKAQEAAERFGAVVALKGSDTFIAGLDGLCYCNRSGNIGLATSGSGDTLAGIIAGLAARGAEPIQAVVWGVTLHAAAGDRLARKMGKLGFLARELLAEIPPLMSELTYG
jgi:ADP-dependent NAD(P)H-hydrate dehydratase